MTDNHTPDTANKQPQDPLSFAMTRDSFLGLYNTMREGMIYTDNTGALVHTNPAFTALLGYPEEDLIGRTMLSLTPEEERAEERSIMQAFLATADSSKELEKGLVHRDGHTVHVRITLWVNRGDTGEPQGVWGLVYDLSDQREIENQVARTMEQYRFLADNSEDVIWALNNRLEYIYISPSAERLRGTNPEAVLGTSLADTLTPESHAVVMQRLQQARETPNEKTNPLALQLRYKDGNIRWTQIQARLMWDKNGEWIGVVGSSRDISARKKVEEKLKTNEEYLKALVSATLDAVGLFTPEGTILTTNERLAHILDSTPRLVAGRSLFDYIPEEYSAEARELFTEAVANRSPVNREVVWSGRIMEITVYPVVGEGGGVTALASYIRDVTDIRFAERERRKTQEQYRLIVETANEGILGLDADHHITYANAILADLLGFEVPEIIGRPITDFIDSKDYAKKKKLLTQCVKGAKGRYEQRFLRRDGSHIWAMVSASPIVGDGNSFLGVFAMVADITEVKQSHQRMLTILNGIDADIYVTDLGTHEILFMNDHMRAKYGLFTPGTTCHKHLRDLDVPCSFCRKSELLDDQGTPLETVVDERYHPATKSWQLTHDRVIEWLEGRVVHMYLAADITKLKAMEEELKQAISEAEAANVSKNEFLANMSHEIRTPLNGLLGMLQLMELTDLEPLHRDYLATAHESGRNLLKILNDILDLSKVESGKLELDESDLELGQLLDSVISVFRHQAKTHGVAMAWSIDESLQRYFVADKGRLRQILFNLVGNAAKFTRSGSITVEAYPLEAGRTPDSQLIFFTVTDTGIGIPQDKLDSVFDPFTQVDGSLTRQFQGTGLGLGIVNRLVRLMGGTISLSSEVDVGTTIAFTVRARPIRANKTDTEHHKLKSGKEGLFVLVAEDEQVNRVVIDHLLTKLGHTATCVASGEEALDILRDNAFDLILTDIQMPGMNGMDTTRVIRGDLLINTPVIALTAYAMKDDKERFLQSGMDGYVAKPFELQELQEEIERVMAEARKKYSG